MMKIIILPYNHRLFNLNSKYTCELCNFLFFICKILKLEKKSFK